MRIPEGTLRCRAGCRRASSFVAVSTGPPTHTSRSLSVDTGGSRLTTTRPLVTMRAVHDQSECTFFAVLAEEDHGAAEIRIHELRHGQEKRRAPVSNPQETLLPIISVWLSRANP